MAVPNSQAKRVRCVELHAKGWSTSLIAKELAVKHPTVKRWCRQIRANAVEFLFGPKRKTARKTKLSRRDKERMVKFVSHHQYKSLNDRFPLRKAARKIKKIGINVSKSTLHAVCKAAGMYSSAGYSRPELTAEHKRMRVAIAKARKEFEWLLAAFSDECTLSIDSGHNVRHHRYWVYDQTGVPKEATHKFPVSQQILGIITPNGGPAPIPINGSLDSQAMQLLLQQALPSVNAMMGGHEWMLVHDKSPPFASASTQAFLQDRPDLLPGWFHPSEWPSNSPDLNLIENVWARLAEAVSVAVDCCDAC